MATKVKHVYGALANVDNALSEAKIDAYDILLVKDADGKPVVGWIDAEGQKCIVDTQNVVKVKEENLPESGVEGKIYIFKEEAYIWDGAAFKPLAKSVDVSELEAQIETKCDEAKVLELIEQAAESTVDIVEI